MKRLLVTLGCIVLLFSLSACGQNESNEPEETREYDFVIASGGGYNIVANANPDMVGVMDDDGNWIHPLSADHPLISDGQIRRTRESIVLFPSWIEYRQRQITRESSRRMDIASSYSHYEGSVFSLIRTAAPNSWEQRVTVMVARYFDARNNVLLD